MKLVWSRVIGFKWTLIRAHREHFAIMPATVDLIIELYHAFTILVMFHVSNNSNES